MKRIMAILAAVALILVPATPAFAHGKPAAHPEKVTVCHARGPNTAKNGWVKIEVSTNSTKLKGHWAHKEDIIEAYSSHPDGKNLGNGGQAILDNGCKKVVNPPPAPGKAFVTVIWKGESATKHWPQTIVDHVQTKAPNLNAFDSLLKGKCVFYQVDVYRYTTKSDRDKVNVLVSGGKLYSPNHPAEPLVSYKVYGNTDCDTPTTPTTTVTETSTTTITSPPVTETQTSTVTLSPTTSTTTVPVTTTVTATVTSPGKTSVLTRTRNAIVTKTLDSNGRVVSQTTTALPDKLAHTGGVGWWILYTALALLIAGAAVIALNRKTGDHTD